MIRETKIYFKVQYKTRLINLSWKANKKDNKFLIAFMTMREEWIWRNNWTYKNKEKDGSKK